MTALGGRCVFAAEWEPGLQDLYETNYGIRPHGDITAVPLKAIPRHDVLCAGFPCQPFSKAGEQRGFEHTEQGQLFFNVINILKSRRPSYFILENVPNLLNHDGGRTFQLISRQLRDAGYSVDHDQYSPHDFGVPQIRDRVYLVGSRNGLADFEWPKRNRKATSIRSVLGVGEGTVISPQVNNVLSAWDAFLKESPSSVALPSFPVWSMEFGATYPFEGPTPLELLRAGGPPALAEFYGSRGQPLRGLSTDQILAALPSHAKRPGEEFPRWKQLYIEQNRAFYAANRKWIDPWLPRVAGFHSSHQKFEWNCQGEPRTLWNSVVQLRASGVRVKRPTTAPSLIAMTDSQVPIIAWEKRYMTPEECARLQSLDGIALPASRPKAFRALGNAVNARVVETLADRLLSFGDGSRRLAS